MKTDVHKGTFDEVVNDTRVRVNLDSINNTKGRKRLESTKVQFDGRDFRRSSNDCYDRKSSASAAVTTGRALASCKVQRPSLTVGYFPASGAGSGAPFLVRLLRYRMFRNSTISEKTIAK